MRFALLIRLATCGLLICSVWHSAFNWNVAERIGSSKFGVCLETGNVVVLHDVQFGVSADSGQFIVNIRHHNQFRTFRTDGGFAIQLYPYRDDSPTFLIDGKRK